MKKGIKNPILVLAVMIVLVGQVAWAAEKVTQSMSCDSTREVPMGTVCTHVFNITFAPNGTVADTVVASEYMPYLRNKVLYSMLIIPVALTDQYDITLIDDNGWDMCQSQALNQGASTKSAVLCAASGKPYSTVYGGTLTLNVDNNSLESTLTIISTYSK